MMIAKEIVVMIIEKILEDHKAVIVNLLVILISVVLKAIVETNHNQEDKMMISNPAIKDKVNQVMSEKNVMDSKVKVIQVEVDNNNKTEKGIEDIKVKIIKTLENKCNLPELIIIEEEGPNKIINLAEDESENNIIK